jgi:hypothetical protein
LSTTVFGQVLGEAEGEGENWNRVFAHIKKLALATSIFLHFEVKCLLKNFIPLINW